MNYVLEVDEQHRVVAYTPVCNFAEGTIPEDALIKDDKAVERIMREGIAHVIAGAIVYPPVADMCYQKGEWAYPEGWADRRKQVLHQRLLQVCDGRQDRVGHLVFGEKYTAGQLLRYQRKYQRAKAGLFEVSVAQEIIEAHERSMARFDCYTDVIEQGRQSITHQIDQGNYEAAERLIEQVSLLPLEATIEELLQLLVQ